jgi:uncharacterized protein YjbI with pentapeptide repeats
MDENNQDKAGSKEQTWWQGNKRRLITVTVVILSLFLIFVLLVMLFGWDWTGFTSGESKITKTPQGMSIEYSPGKTLWDWLGLLGALAIPIVVGFGVAWFSHAQQIHDQKLADQRSRSETELADKRAAYEQEINIDRLREELLQGYLDDMAELLLREKLLSLDPSSPVRTIARARTLAVLRRITATRKAVVLQFLHESKLIDKDNPIVDLKGADLSKADLQEADLRGVNLIGVNLRGIKLTGANLSGATLKDAKYITTEELEKQTKLLKGAIMPDGSLHP